MMRAIFRKIRGIFLAAFFLMPGLLTAGSPGMKGNTAFLSGLPYDKSGPEVRSAFDFLKKEQPGSVFLTFSGILKNPGILSGYSVLWYHKPDTNSFTKVQLNKKLIRVLRNYLDEGNNLLLTLEAVKYIVPLGLETVVPADSLKPCIDEGYGRKLGLHSFLSHPAFDSLFGGAYILRPLKDSVFRITGYFGKSLPDSGKVLAVDWDYIFLRENSKLMLEYEKGKGRVVAIGAYTCFSVLNFNRAHLELFMRNVFRYLAAEPKKEGHYWDYSANTVNQWSEDLPTPAFPGSRTGSHPWLLPEEPLALKNRYASRDFYDVAGERMLTMGSEQGGIEEMWAHPFMAFRDYDVGIRFGYRDTIYWLNDERPEIEVRPECFVRTYRFPRAFLKEILVDDPEGPSGAIHYEYRGMYDATLVIRFRTRLRLMWPYPETSTGSISFLVDTVNHRIGFRDKTGMLCTLIGGNRATVQAGAGHYSGYEYDPGTKRFEGIPTGDLLASGVLVYHLEMNDNLDIIYSAAGEGMPATVTAFNEAVQDPYRIYQKARDHVDRLFSQSLTITTPDQDFNTGYRWALLATDRFFVRTPGMGASLVAGYSTTRKGWDGAQKVSGRPGYGWYFGRDGQWSGFALLDCGDFGKVRSELEFYQQYQDLSGKIFHEATTSGVIHYDAADATPLYIVLAGKYYRHTHDTAFLRKSWPCIKKAIDFCYSTDTDHDHLIENTNVGHGWVEGGELYGCHATFYLQGCWVAALREAQTMATALSLPGAVEYGREAEVVKEIIDRDFWNDKNGFYSYGMNRDGTFRAEPTILPAVPMYFRATDPFKSGRVLEQYAGNSFSTDWGTRIIRDDSPLFNPRGYHYGSVWPLFTGWTSLAEYAYGNYDQGFSHLMENLDIYKYWGLGFAEEVLNGARYQPSGVCDHQCWSETMVLQPAIEGMLGLEVNADRNEILLAPHFPAGWDSVTVSNIRMADRVVTFEMKRTSGKYYFTFYSPGKDSVKIDLFPSFPAGTRFGNMTSGKKLVPFNSLRDLQKASLLANLKVSGKMTLELDYLYGIGVLPLVPDPKPGYPAAGLRIISAGMAGDRYLVTVEDRPGTSGEVKIYCNGLKPDQIENGTLSETGNGYFTVRVNFDEGTAKYEKKTVAIRLLKNP